MIEPTLKKSIDRIIKEINIDKGYRISWEANIAMAFKDAFVYSGHKHDPHIIHEVASKAAAAFIDQLIGKDLDGDGMMSIEALHRQAKPLT